MNNSPPRPNPTDCKGHQFAFTPPTHHPCVASRGRSATGVLAPGGTQARSRVAAHGYHGRHPRGADRLARADPGTGHDKANHILAFLVLAGLADLAYPGPAPGRGGGKWLILLAYGLFIETVQYFSPYREFSGWDLVADG